MRLIRAIDPGRAAIWMCAVMLALALKWHYSTADADGLRWILAPTASLVEVISGARFEFESRAGYMNREQRFLIAPSCSGVNFLITSFLTLALVHRASLILSAAIAYATTVAANAVRISIALQLHDAGVTWGPLDPARVHRLEGIVVYFAFLLLIFAIGERLARSSGDAPPRSFPRVLIPLAVYYGVTLGIPIANGALSQGARFGEHALFTLLVPLAMIVLLRCAGVRIGTSVPVGQRSRMAARP